MSGIVRLWTPNPGSKLYATLSPSLEVILGVSITSEPITVNIGDLMLWLAEPMAHIHLECQRQNKLHANHTNCKCSKSNHGIYSRIVWINQAKDISAINEICARFPPTVWLTEAGLKPKSLDSPRRMSYLPVKLREGWNCGSSVLVSPVLPP